MNFIVIKKIVIDPITIVLVCMFFLLGFNYYSKYITQPKNNSLKPLAVARAKQVCIDNDDITDCYPIDSDISKVFAIKDEKDDLYTILITNR